MAKTNYKKGTKRAKEAPALLRAEQLTDHLVDISADVGLGIVDTVGQGPQAVCETPHHDDDNRRTIDEILTALVL